MVDVHKAVKAVRQLSIGDSAGLAGTRIRVRTGTSLDVAIRMFALADGDTAGQSSLVVVDAVVGDFQVVRPSVDEDTAAALRAVGDRQTINPRRVALEAARERIVGRRRVGSAIVDTSAVRQKGCARGESIGRERIRSGRKLDALGEHGNSGSFIGAHEGRFLELFREVAVRRRLL